MEYYGLIKDNIYKKSNINYYRKTVRAVLVNEKKEIGLLHIIGKDIFGERDHYETPGGGVNDNEEFINTLKREILEECGYSIKNIKEIGKIDIEYFVLNRVDEGYFYYCEIDSYLGNNLEEYEKSVIKEIKWISINDILEIYKNFNVQNVGKMIHKRDLLIIERAKELGYFD